MQKALTKRYGNKTALDQVSFSLMPGKIIGLLSVQTAAEKKPR